MWQLPCTSPRTKPPKQKKKFGHNIYRINYFQPETLHWPGDTNWSCTLLGISWASLSLHFRAKRGKSSSPFSTWPSTPGASCPLWSHPSWEVGPAPTLSSAHLRVQLVNYPPRRMASLLSNPCCSSRWRAVFRRRLLRSGFWRSGGSDGCGFG